MTRMGGSGGAFVFRTAVAMIATLLMMGCRAQADSGFVESKVIHIGGHVLCQDCSKGWNDWIKGAYPLEGAKVAVSCVDSRKRVIHHGVDATDKQGSFQLIIDRHINGKKLDIDGCVVRLVSSAHSDCNIMTDFTGGKEGLKLTRPSLIYRDLIEYTVGPFYFTSPMCEKPEDLIPKVGDFMF